MLNKSDYKNVKELNYKQPEVKWIYKCPRMWESREITNKTKKITINYEVEKYQAS